VSAESVLRVADLERAIVLVEGQEDRHLLTALKPSWLVFAHNCEPEPYRAPQSEVAPGGDARGVKGSLGEALR
jgi:hypothetical protein